MRRLAEPGAKLLDQPRLAHARLADDQRQLTLAFARALPAPGEKIELLLASNERRQRPRAAAPARAARANDAIECRRLGRAFQRMRAAILGDEQARDLTLNAGGDQHRSRIGQRLDPRGDIGRVAEHLARCVDHHLPGRNADAGDELRTARAGVLAVQFGERALDGQRGANRAFGIVLLRDRVSEQRHQPVAELLGDTPAHSRHRLRGSVEVGADQIAPILGVERGRNGG